jgi:site-specific recombinase XerD
MVLVGGKGVPMSAFVVVYQDDVTVPFAVVSTDGSAVPEVREFLEALVARGRASYTVRSYSLGLADFLSWLEARGDRLESVDLRVIQEYVMAFRIGAKKGAAPVRAEVAGQLHPVTRKAFPTVERQPRTVNHRLSVLSSFFSFLIERDDRAGSGPWQGRMNPVPAGGGDAGAHGSPGRDAPQRGRRGELRLRNPRRIPRGVEAGLVERLIGEARSWRDKALLTLLWRTGQRIGDWHAVHGQHGLLGLRVGDVDERASCVVVRLKGARDEHLVPVTEDFWPLWRHYLVDERCWAETPAAWVGFRRGKGKPLTYSTFESALRAIGGRLDINVNAHMFRHSLAQAVVETSGLKVAQEILGHRHIGTTADIYVRTDQRAMVEAVARAKLWCDLDAHQPLGLPDVDEFVFAYDPFTVAELDAVAHLDLGEGRDARS